MTNGIPRVALGEVLVPVCRSEKLSPDRDYRLLGARWYAQGLYVKDTKLGAQIAARELYAVEEGDFVYNRLFAWKGSFAVASAEHHRCYVSNEFPCFRVNRDKAEPDYLWYYFSRASAWDEALGLSTGGTPTSRNRLKEGKLLAMKVPLPPIGEQRRIVSRVKGVLSQIEEVRKLRESVDNELALLCRSVLMSAPSVRTPMHEIVSLRRSNVKVDASETYSFAGVYCFGRGVFSGNTKAGTEFAYSSLTRVKAGEFVYPKLMAWEGALGIVPPECDGLVVSPEFPVFTVNTDRVLPEVLDVYFRSPEVWPQLAEISTGTNVRRRRLHPSAFLKYEIPLPSLAVQNKLRKIKKHADAVRRHRESSSLQFDALLPSILDKAFRGEL